MFDLNNSNRLDVLYNYSTVYKSLKEIGYEDVSAIIKFPFDEFFSYFTTVIQHVDNLEYKLNNNLNSFAKKQLDKNILDSTKFFGIITFKIMYKNSKNNNVFKIPYSIIDANDRIEYKYLEVDKNNYFNEVLDLYNREFEELLVMIQKLNDKYYNLQFKSKEDLKQYIFNFYSSVN
ncbi:hypothetical protein [Macrococcoides canis]|uniref:hypothetical protein n=1 Tax=Macrococcoides canis TaxID=1855823 RepID=UPI001CAA84FD|nr:hypothetical protein [Macrococcus canis]